MGNSIAAFKQQSFEETFTDAKCADPNCCSHLPRHPLYFANIIAKLNGFCSWVCMLSALGGKAWVILQDMNTANKKRREKELKKYNIWQGKRLETMRKKRGY